MKTDLEIAKECKIKPITEIAKELGLREEQIELYGKYKAKIQPMKDMKAKLILVTAINPTKAGEGKTTVSIGLADAMKKRGRKVCLALREPSLGPVFGIKGGACGGGYAQIVPMEEINLHFTGDLHAITAANNLIAAMIDNHLYFGNKLKIKEVYFRRCMDLNDRALRKVVLQGGKTPREDGFDITAASELMAILCLSENLADLKKRIGSIIVGIDEDGNFVKVSDLKAEGGAAALLKDAVKPNLVQTLEGTPAIVHGGPFANIAHGCNSIIATRTAMSLSEYTVTEAGFGADLGAEKFLDVKCREGGIEPSAVVLVSTVRALKMHGGQLKEELAKEDMQALARGIENLGKHMENLKEVYNLPVVVAVNRFFTDTEKEIAFVKDYVEKKGCRCALTEVFAKGGEGGEELAEKVEEAIGEKSGHMSYAYDRADSVKEKIEKVATKIYGADGCVFEGQAERKIAEIESGGFSDYPVIIAKTQYSLSDDPSLIGRPVGFKIKIRDIILRGGAKFIVAIAGDIMLMPGLSRSPQAERIDIDKDGEISGLF